MKNLPEAEIYARGLKYWPYKASLDLVLEKVVELAPRNGRLLDMMCGPGYLLGLIHEKRPDLTLVGIDLDSRYVYAGRQQYQGITFDRSDILSWKPDAQFEIVICTGSLHHLEYEKQEAGIEQLSRFVLPQHPVIISDCYISDYADEIGRRLGAAKLGYEYLVETIKNGADEDVIAWTAEILWNDVMKKEFKTSTEQRLPILQKYFSSVKTTRTWPTRKNGHGDFVHVCIR